MSVSQPSFTVQAVAAAMSRAWLEPLLGLSTGVLGGAIHSKILSAPMSHSILLGGIFGLAFSLFFARRATTPGAGLIWGLGSGLLLWFVMPTGIDLLLLRSASIAMLNDAFSNSLPARRARLWLQHGLGPGIWHLPVVFRPAHSFPHRWPSASGLVRRTRHRVIRFAGRLHYLRIHPGYHLCIPGPDMGETVHSIRSMRLPNVDRPQQGSPVDRVRQKPGLK